MKTCVIGAKLTHGSPVCVVRLVTLNFGHYKEAFQCQPNFGKVSENGRMTVSKFETVLTLDVSCWTDADGQPKIVVVKVHSRGAARPVTDPCCLPSLVQGPLGRQASQLGERQ